MGRIRRRLRKWLGRDIPSPPVAEALAATMFDLIPKGAVGAEIGVWKGDTSARLLRRARPERLYLFDLWRHMDDPVYQSALVRRHSAEEIEAIYQNVLARFAPEIAGGRVIVRRQDSVAALGALRDGELDFAYVDGDHSHGGVSRDLAALWPKMAVGGVVICDDYKIGGWYQDGAIRAINEFIGAHADQVVLIGSLSARVAFRKRPADGSDLTRRGGGRGGDGGVTSPPDPG